jgi:aspartate racemase
MRDTPRRLGLLGGTTWHSSIIYERLLNEGVQAALPGQTADLVIRSYNFGHISAQHAADAWDELATEYIADARWLQDGGADAIIICANTMHMVAPQVEAAIDIPVINIIDETAKAILAAGFDNAGLLATGYTMRMPFYRDRMAQQGVTTIAPEEPDLSDFHELIYNRVGQGIIEEQDFEGARAAAAKLISRGAQGIISGCTEVPLVLTQDDLDVPLFDSMQLHVDAALEFALAD